MEDASKIDRDLLKLVSLALKVSLLAVEESWQIALLSPHDIATKLGNFILHNFKEVKRNLEKIGFTFFK